VSNDIDETVTDNDELEDKGDEVIEVGMVDTTRVLRSFTAVGESIRRYLLWDFGLDVNVTNEEVDFDFIIVVDISSCKFMIITGGGGV
jgi:hypothetical protein